MEISARVTEVLLPMQSGMDGMSACNLIVF